MHWQAAYLWLCRTRLHTPPNAGVWHLRFHWALQGPQLFAQVASGGYHLSAMQLVGLQAAEKRAQWCAQDALVLKWAALQIAEFLPKHARCAHVKGHGGGQESVRQVAQALMCGEFSFVYRTDIRGYYRHIRKTQLLSQIQRYVHDPVIQDLLRQYLYYSVEDGGEFYTPEQGICRSCPLSPLFGASLLYHVDTHFDEQKGVFYARYMDDFLLLTRSRWPLRNGVKKLHEFLNLGGFETHPDKTQLGRIEHGFDWLGVWFSAAEPTIAPRAISNHRARRLRLYEQARRRGLSAAATHARVQAYEMRWTIWAEGLLRRSKRPVPRNQYLSER